MSVRMGLAVLAAAVLFSPVTASAQPNSADIRIRVIHASQGRKHADPRLHDLQRYLDIYKYSS